MTENSSPAVALEPIAYLHTLHMDGDCNFEEVTRTATSPFDASRPVTTTPLYAALPPSSGWEAGVEAPKHGRRFLAWVPSEKVDVQGCRYQPAGYGDPFPWKTDLGNRMSGFGIKAWQPLPPPPSKGASEHPDQGKLPLDTP